MNTVTVPHVFFDIYKRFPEILDRSDIQWALEQLLSDWMY